MLFDRVKAIVPAPHNMIGIQQEEILGMNEAGINAGVGDTGFEFLKRKIIYILLITGHHPPVIMVHIKAVGKPPQLRHRIMLGVYADGKKMYNRIVRYK